MRSRDSSRRRTAPELAARRAALIAALLLSTVCTAAQAAGARIASSRHFPAPASQRADVSADANRSRLTGRIDVAKCDEPESAGLLCGDFVSARTSGYSWYCSRHWAVKTDLGDSGAAEILVLLELAWPHYEALFGATPGNSSTTRLALVVGSCRDSLKRAMIDDGMFAFTLGGVTQEGYAASYLYAGAPYQTRYIVLHEATHLYQYALSGDTRGCYGFFVEGIADSLSSHVFDSAACSLAVNVLDRAPIHNHLADGLAEWRRRGRPSFSALYGDAALSRPLSVLLVAFLQSTPDCAASWRKYCRAIIVRDGATPAKEASDKLLDSLFGGAAGLDAPFARWMDGLAPSFTLVQRDFDQDGDSFVSGGPASADAPAILEGRADRCGAVSIRWREPPERGSFARVAFLPDSDGGQQVSLVVSNTERSASAILEGGAGPGRDLGGRRLAERIRRGEVVVFDDFPDLPARRWRIAASQPGVEFSFAGPRRGQDNPAQCAAPAAKAGALAPDAITPPSLKGIDYISDWKALGPFSLPGGEFAHPQQAIPAVNFDAVATLDDGTFATWRDVAVNRNSVFPDAPIVNLTRTFGRQANNSFAYLAAEIESAEDCEREIAVGVSDGIELFVNGGQVLDDVACREWRNGDVRARVRLAKGRNLVVARLAHKSGVWLFSAGLLPRPAQ